MELIGTTLILGAIAVIAILALIIFIVRRYRVAAPNEALIVVGRRRKPVTNLETGEETMDLAGQRVVIGGGTFVKPFFERVHKINLTSRSIPVKINAAVSSQGIRLSLEAVAIVKVGGTEDKVRAAAQRFLGQQDQIDNFTREVLAGSLRSIVGTLSVDEIISDRVAFAQKVKDESADSLNNQGLVIDTFQIQDVNDDGNYLRDRGRAESAAAARNAAIAEANAQRESSEAQSKAQALVAAAERDLAVRRAETKAETEQAEARANAAGELARAQQEQEVLAQQEIVAERQAALTERQLDTEIRKPADARRYEAEAIAQGERQAAIYRAEADKASSISTAEAQAESVRLSTEVNAARVERTAEAELVRRRSEAEAIELEGRANAAATEAQGKAEAEALRARAEAFEKFGSAAQTQAVVDILPQLAREISAPMSAISDLTVISNDGAGQLSRTVGSNIKETLEVLRSTTGIDLVELLGNLGNTRPSDSASSDAELKMKGAPGALPE